MFFEVRRVVLQPGAATAGDTSGRFHVLNVVEGDGVLVETADGPAHSLAYAETLLVPGVDRPGDLGGFDPWKDAESCLHSGSTPMSCVNAR
jgi:hypothetical protein